MCKAGRGGFGRGRGRGGRGDRGGRGGKGGRAGKADAEKDHWVPVTKLGRLVEAGHIKSIDDIFLYSLPIKVGSLSLCRVRDG